MNLNYKVYKILKNEDPDLTREQVDKAMAKIDITLLRSAYAQSFTARGLQPGDKIGGKNPRDTYPELADESATAILVYFNQKLSNVEFIAPGLGQITKGNLDQAMEAVLDSVINAGLVNEVVEAVQDFL